MKNNAMIPIDIQTGTTRHESTEYADDSPPSSPPPIQNLCTDTTIVGQGTNSTQPITLLPTRNNKAGLISNTGRKGKRQLFLLPKSTELPPMASNNSDNEKQDGSNRHLTKIQQIYGYMQRLMVSALMNRKYFVLVINGLHQVWRARFFLARTCRTLASYPYRQQYNHYRTTAVQLVKLAVLMVKKEQRTVLVDMAQRQNKQVVSMTLGALFRWAQVAMMVMWTRLMGMSRLGLKTGYRMFKFFGTWDSLALAFVSVAMTWSLQHPARSG